MADQEHVKILLDGANNWNEWRQAHPEVEPDLSGANLSGAQLSYVNLENANLVNTKFRNAKLFRANLANSSLEKANLFGVDAREANFTLVQAKAARFIGAKLDRAILSQADLAGTFFHSASLNATSLRGADLTNADLTKTDESFHMWKVSLSGRPIIPPNYPDTPVELTIGLAPHTRRILADGKYLEALWNVSNRRKRLGLHLWGITCGYGQSFLRWTLTSFLLIIIFSLILMQVDLCISTARIKEIQDESEMIRVVASEVVRPSFGHSLYYSIVTFTTLGYGDISPVTGWGRFWVAFEVIVGYMMLGGLVSIFANKLARLS